MITWEQKVVGGLSCGQVLEQLSDYVDGDLAAAARTRIEEHLRGCDGCTRFGGEFQTTLQALRAHLTRARGLPEGLRDRLLRAVAAEPQEG